MIVGAEAKGMMQAYLRDAGVADPKKPYVMWPEARTNILCCLLSRKRNPSLAHTGRLACAGAHRLGSHPGVVTWTHWNVLAGWESLIPSPGWPKPPTGPALARSRHEHRLSRGRFAHHLVSQRGFAPMTIRQSFPSGLAFADRQVPPEPAPSPPASLPLSR